MAITVFGGGAVQTAYVSFTALDITPNSITLVWPTSYFDVPSESGGIFYDVLAASITVDNAIGNVNSITLPNAMESSVGSNFIITNIGGAPFTLYKSDGAPLIVIPEFPLTSNSFWVQLTDNSTPEGTWQFVQFGAGISNAQAASLAGNGLTAIGTLLNTNIAVEPIDITPYTVVVGDRANLLLWVGGAGIFNMPLIGAVPAGFYISINNEGTGTLTVNGNGTTIDKLASITVSLGQSLSIISDGVKWWTLGFGQNIASSNFASGSALDPSITFTADQTTGIYYYTAPFPPVNPPGIGFTVGSSQVANMTASGLYMNDGKGIILQDSTGGAESSLESNIDFVQLSWAQPLLVSPPTLRLTGTDLSSTVTLGPFATLSFSQSDTAAVMIFNGIDVLFLDDTGASAFTHQVTFNGPILVQNTSTFSAESTFNAPIVSNNTATFNNISTFTLTATFNGPIVATSTLSVTGAVTLLNTLNVTAGVTLLNTLNVTGAVTLTVPLAIASGGTGQNNQSDALNALSPPGAAIGDILYLNALLEWVRLPIGNPGDFLKVSAGNLPEWAP